MISAIYFDNSEAVSLPLSKGVDQRQWTEIANTGNTATQNQTARLNPTIGNANGNQAPSLPWTSRDQNYLVLFKT
jgi:hypothetical protein